MKGIVTLFSQAIEPGPGESSFAFHEGVEYSVEPPTGFEPVTCSLRVSRSTPELGWHQTEPVSLLVTACLAQYTAL